MLSRELTNHFKELYHSHFGVELSDEKTTELSSQLIELVKLTIKK